jgi:biopolymer transport protein ExbD
MKLRRRYMTGRQAASVDVTAFLSLMVILVPFLLITAVFSRLTILELESAAGDSEQAPLQDALQLVVVVREAVIEVQHGGQDSAVRIPRTSDGTDVAALASLMHELKARFPDSQEATLLIEPQIAYDMLVQVMDAVRIWYDRQETGGAGMELFPQISLGEAPVDAAAGGPGQ